MKNKKHKVEEKADLGFIPEEEIHKEEIAEIKVSGIDGIKCSSSNRLASYNSDAGEVVISQNGIVVMISACRSEEHARKIAAKF